MSSQLFPGHPGNAGDKVPTRLLEEAAALHGHRCPSLVYGCRLALILAGSLPPGTVPASLVLHHTSACLRDGATVVLRERFPDVNLVSAGGGGCSLEAAWTGGRMIIEVSPAVREAVDRIKRESSKVEEFRVAGVDYLLSLADNDFAQVSR